MPANFRFNIKSRLIISGVLFTLGLFIIFQISLSQIQDILPAQAAEANKLRGWGWSENIGWISMNCYNDYPECNGGTRNSLWCLTDNDCLPDGVCEKSGDFENCCPGGNVADCPGGLSSDYGVNYNTTSGKLTGYAWSDGVGWICFGESCQKVCLGGSNNGACCNDDVNCSGATCPGGVCGGKPPHGFPASWACVGSSGWNCTEGAEESCHYDTQCVAGVCRFGCNDDNGEDFVDSVDPKDNTTTYCSSSGVNSNLKAHWKMEETSGETIDSSGNDNTGTLMPVNTPPIQALGKFSNGLQFDGSEDYIEVTDSDSLSPTGNLTIEAWIKRGLIGTEQTIVGKWNGLNGSYRLWFSADNKLNFTVSNGTNTATAIQKGGICVGNNRKVCDGGSNNELPCNDSTATNDCPGGFCREPFCVVDDNCETENGEICKNAPIIDTKKWHHITGKYVAFTSVNNPSLQLFIDGSPIHAGIAETIPNSLTNRTENLYIGATPGKSAYFKGVIDNVSIWSCINSSEKLRGRQPVDIWNDARIELDGWARITNLGEKGWLKLKGFTKDGRVWGSSLNYYSTFYTFDGYMANRYVDTSMDSNGLVGHWRMDEPDWTGTNNIVVDSSINTNNGLAYNGVNVTNQGIFNSAGDFDGVNDYVDTSLSTDFSGSGDFTVVAWFKGTNSAYAVTQSHVASPYASDWIFGGSGTDIFWMRSQVLGSASSIEDDLWHHLAMVWDKSSATYQGYVDGVSIGTSEIVSDYSGVNSIKIGTRGDATTTFTNGIIDSVAIYNRALTPTEIQAAYNKSIPACMGWEDHEHEYDDPPEPLSFDNLTVEDGSVCSQLLVYWDPSVWAENYTYWRAQEDSVDLCGICTNENNCGTSDYIEYNVLADSCTETECSLSDTGLTYNTGYCYAITAYNEIGSTWSTDNQPTHPSPYWRSTTLCAPEVLDSDTNTCGQVILNWTKGENTDGYNIYRSLAETGSTSCDDLTNDGCELTGHLAEALDYNPDKDAVDDLIAQWKMNESSWDGTNKEVTDSSARTPLNSGTAHCVGVDCVEPTTTTGIFDRAGIFDGADDYVSANDRAQFDLGSGDNITIEAWINLTSAPTDYNMIISKGYSPGYEFRINASKKLQFVNVATEYLNYYITSNSPITTTDGTTWYHVAVTKNNTTGAAKLYINGVLDNSATMDTLDYSNNDEVRIGRDADDGCAAGTAFFTGYIDNLAFYNVAKTAEQIRIDYESGNCGETGCGLAYVCDDAESIDKCGANNTCCYTDSRIIPYINYYYQITATGETGETPPSVQIGPEQTICFPAPSEEEE